MAGLADTVTPYYSNPFSLLGWDGVDLTSYPLTAGVKLAGTSLVTRRLSCYIQASYDLTNWANVDTISQVDSVNTLILKTGLTLNGYRAPYYRSMFWEVHPPTITRPMILDFTPGRENK